jgi:hypothetical protein
MILSISEILDKASKAKTFEDKVTVLRNNTTPALIWVLKIAFHPDIKWLLPPGNPPYKPSEFFDVHGALRRDYRKLQYFVSNQGYDSLRQLKREVMFVELLETIHKDDAVLLLAIKDGKMPYKSISYRLVAEAFPGLLPPRDSETKENEQAEKDVQA